MGDPAPASPPSGSSVGSGSDRQIAEQAAQQLLVAAHHAQDPALKASFSTALAALHKYIAQDDKEHQQALAGKMSPRIMARAHGTKLA
jgi:hypothetical protein